MDTDRQTDTDMYTYTCMCARTHTYIHNTHTKKKMNMGMDGQTIIPEFQRRRQKDQQHPRPTSALWRTQSLAYICDPVSKEQKQKKKKKKITLSSYYKHQDTFYSFKK